MSGVSITVTALKTAAAIVAIVDDRIDPIYAPPLTNDDIPRKAGIIVNLIHEADDAMLSGAAEYAEARVSVECRAARGSQSDRLGEQVKSTLTAIIQQRIGDYEATFFKEGTDATGYRDNVGVAYRTIDFYVRWRSVAGS